MKRRPWPLIILAVLHILSPFGNKILSAYVSHVSLSDYMKIWWLKASPEVMLTSLVLPMVAGVLILICRRWSFILYLALMATILILSIKASLTYGNSLAYLTVAGMTILDLLVVCYFMIPVVRSIYFDPRMRWWETAPRFRLEAPVRYLANGTEWQGTSANFSETGLFIISENLPADGSVIEIELVYKDVPLKTTGTVIHHGQMNKLGFGVQFASVGPHRKQTQLLHNLLMSEQAQLKDRMPGPEDSFVSWLKTLLATGRGLIPTRRTRQ